MKILHAITLADLGGAQSVLINICNRAVQNGHEIIVVSESDGPMWNQLDSRIVQVKIHELHRKINVFKDFVALLKLKKIYSSIKPDIIHLHSSKIGILGRLAFPKNKVIYTVHGFDSIRIANRRFLFIEKILKKKAKKIVAVSNYDFNMLYQEGISENVMTIYNGIEDCSNSDDQKKLSKNTIEKLQQIQRNYFVVMVISRISMQKKFDLFCEIAKAMESDKRFLFVWIGNKSEEDVSSNNILMLGEISNASQCFRYADLCLLPSNYEGLPISIIEALSFGVPVVASDVGGVSEILNGFNGFAVENTVDSFVMVLEKIKKSEKLFQSLSLNARQTYLEQFTINKMSDQYEKLYWNVKNNDCEN